MATIDIYPGAPNSGGSFSSANASAYAALAAGSLNTVRWRGGYRYVCEAASWWGLGEQVGCRKPCQHVVVPYGGSSEVIVDCLQRYGPADTSGTWSAGDGLWYIDLFAANAAPDPERDQIWLGAVAADTWASTYIGASYRQASSKANCSGDGLTIAGMLAGKGVWFFESVGGIGRLWVWCPNGAAQPPAVQWGGIGVMIPPSTAPTTSCNKKHSPFVFGRNSVGSDDPSGSNVGEGFRIVGARIRHLGSNPVGSQADNISSITYNGVRAYGGMSLLRMGSDTAGVSLSGWTLDGCTYDDMIEPIYNPLGPSDGVGVIGASSDRVYLEPGVHSLTVRDLDMRMQSCHTAINCETDGAASGDRPSSVLYSDVRLTCKPVPTGTYVTARPFSCRNCTDLTLSEARFEGFSTRGHLSGIRTLISGVTWQLTQRGADGHPEPASCVDARVDLEDAGFRAQNSLIIQRCTFDRRGDSGRGVNAPIACVELLDNAAMPAGFLTLRDSLLLGDAPTAGIWHDFRSQGGSRAQHIIGNQFNLPYEVALSTGQLAPSMPADASTFAATFSGTVTGNAYSTQPSGVRRYGELALGAQA